MATQLENNTSTIESLITAINAMPNAVTIDTTLTQSGQAADAKTTGDAISEISTNLNTHTSNTSNPHNVTAAQVGAAASSHTQAASSITAGTFAGAVVAQTSSQTPGTSMLRNSKLVSTETNPSYNGEICWTYE